MQKITNCLWFNGQAEEAVKFYCSIFKNSKVMGITYYGEGMHMPKGTVLTVQFQLDGQDFLALNGGPEFPFTEAISLMVNCDTQQDLDMYWYKLSAGGKEVQCGWLKDKYGLSWQIVPTALSTMMKDPKRFGNVMQEVMKMIKLDIKKMQDAFDKAA